MIFDVLLLEAILLLCVSLGLGAWQRDPATTGRLTLCALSLAIFAITLGEVLALRGLTSELWADRVKYAGLLALPPLWLGFVAHVANLDAARRIPWFPLLLLIPGAFLYGFLWSDRFGVLFLTTVQDGDDLHRPLWWIGTFYGQALATIGSAILASSAFRTHRRGQRMRRLWLAAASAVPLVGNALYIGGLFAWSYDPTPLMLGVALLAMRAAVFFGGLLEPLPISQRDLLHQLPLGVILTDRRGNLVEMSDVAGNRLGVSEKFALGRSIDDVLAWCEPTALRSCELTRRGSPVGRLILLDEHD